ncbi:hypothetical protein LTR64_007866 [Lithohypha guttulata]|uniref:uncharacterized protein n=1 Tax=Lithohypha guttulata TaxID=1690604 RepID=UPI002DE04526|nr:hypothetical protein LTR51_008267 [Lithohypha guttulata]
MKHAKAPVLNMTGICHMVILLGFVTLGTSSPLNIPSSTLTSPRTTVASTSTETNTMVQDAQKWMPDLAFQQEKSEEEKYMYIEFITNEDERSFTNVPFIIRPAECHLIDNPSVFGVGDHQVRICPYNLMNDILECQVFKTLDCKNGSWALRADDYLPKTTDGGLWLGYKCWATGENWLSKSKQLINSPTLYPTATPIVTAVEPSTTD